MSHLQEWIAVLAMALLHFVWQGCVIVAVSAVVLRLLRRHTAQTRYAFASFALLLCLLLPLLYLLQHAPTTLDTGNPSIDQVVNTSDGSVQSAQGFSAESVEGSAKASVDSLWNFVLRFGLPGYLPYLVIFWLCGVLILLVRMLAGVRWVTQQVRQAAQQPDPVWQAKLQRMAAAMGMTKTLRFGLSDSLEFPVTAGWWCPIVILPSALLSGMPVELIEALLAHEVAHIKRFDYLVNLLQSLIEIVLFYHPAVWWLSRQIRQEREQIADDLAASLLGEPRRLALALSELERYQFTHPQLAQVAHGGNLMLRIKRLVQPDSTVNTAAWKIVFPGLALGATCLALFAQAHTVNTNLSTPLNANPTAVVSPNVHAVSGTVLSTIPASADLNKSAAITPKSVKASDKDTNFALVKPRGEHNTFVHTSRSGMAEIEKLKRQHAEEFLWFSEKGQSYWIKDPEILSQAEAAYKPVEELGTQMEQHGKKMEQYGTVMEKLGAEMAALSVNEREIDRAVEASMHGFEKKLAAYEKKLEAAAAKVEQATTPQARQHALENLSQQQAKFQAVAAELQKKDQAMQQQQAQIQQQLEQSLRPVQDLSKKMEEAAKPMDELGKQMDQLGKKMDALSQQAEKQILELIQTAKQKKLVLPVTPASGA
ncbi:M56 family metallopeptidase [Undibacterium flavidum]|uniref:M48 family metalloprotease n=1 Tax=Undibacterium flavidum TaxID=2762297 RepID=A0ABR6YAE3_9BURK|nr:M56 family metallopeptidase [Undibacterium flavidum]MBC3873613.1 M48 family metalloprotease [Undibacterium flavidum]